MTIGNSNSGVVAWTDVIYTMANGNFSSVSNGVSMANGSSSSENSDSASRSVGMHNSTNVMGGTIGDSVNITSSGIEHTGNRSMMDNISKPAAV